MRIHLISSSEMHPLTFGLVYFIAGVKEKETRMVSTYAGNIIAAENEDFQNEIQSTGRFFTAKIKAFDSSTFTET